MPDPGRESDAIDFGVLNELIGYRLRRAQMNFFNKFSDVCADLGISPGLFAVLEIVHRNPGLTQTAVAQALGNDRSAMVAAVDKLEQMDLIERKPSKNDRRSYALYMTDNGLSFFKKAQKRVQEHEDELASRLKNDKERKWLLDVLYKLSV